MEISSEQQESKQDSIDAKLIGTSKDKKVKLYEEANGIKLHINGNQKVISWSYPGDTGTDSQVFYTDVTCDGKEYNFNYGFDPAPDQKPDRLGFSGVYTYYLENQKIKVNLGVAVPETTAYVCEFMIIYKFDSTKNKFVVDQIEVKPIEK